MAFGTAPRRVSSGVWITRSGRKLTAAGSAYWENLYRSGRTTGEGHMTTPSVVQTKPKPPARKPEPKAVDFLALARGQGGPRHDPRKTYGVFGVETQDSPWHPLRRANRVLQAGSEGLARSAGLDQAPNLFRPRKTRTGMLGNPVPGVRPETIERSARFASRTARTAGALTIGPDLTATLSGREHSGRGLGLDLAMLPFLGLGPVRAARGAFAGSRAIAAGHGLEQAGELASAAYHAPGWGQRAGAAFSRRTHRGLAAGEDVYFAPTARSRVAQTIFERPMDWASQRLGGEGRFATAVRGRVPNADVEARVARGRGREAVQIEGRRTTQMAPHVRVLPEDGSPESTAHFWYRQLPSSERNVGGLQRVHDRWGEELQQTDVRLQQAKAQRAEIKNQLRELGQVKPTTEEEYQALWKQKTALMKRSGELKNDIQDLPRIAQNLGLQMRNMREVITANPTARQDVLDAMKTMIQSREATGREFGGLSDVTAEAQHGRVSDWLGIDPQLNEADPAMYVGHRLTQSKRGLYPGRPGVGKLRKPEGFGQQYEGKLLATGRLRQSAHIPFEDWVGAEQYRQGIRARNVFGRWGRGFETMDLIDPKTEYLVNPKGVTVPAARKTNEVARMVREGADPEQIQNEVMGVLGKHLGEGDDPALRMKSDELTRLISEGANSQEVHRASQAVKDHYVAEGENAMKRLIEEAKQAGLDPSELRVVPKRMVDRYYSQFEKVQTGDAMRQYDRLVSAVATSLIFARPGYIPKNFVQNIAMALPHQGAFLLANGSRAAQIVLPGRDEITQQLYEHIAQEVGLGASASLGQDAAGKIGQAIAGGSSKVADLPLRTAAFLHEAAAAGVISKYNPKLTPGDKQKLLSLFTDDSRAVELNNISARANESMADFSRLTPKQRKYARRVLIIPGWLWAGSRYPVHFAATHPGRSAGLAYVAAGEPGAPDRFKVNKPIDEYFQKGLPSFVQGIPTPWGTERTTSISPYSTPAELFMSAAQMTPRTAASYVNPVPVALYNTAKRVVETPSGETRRTSFRQAFQRNVLERLAPTAGFIQNEINPPSGEGRMYPDTSRRGLLTRELGIFPTKIDKDAALRLKLNEQGLTHSAELVNDKIDVKQRLHALGEEGSNALEGAYSLLLRRNNRLDRIHASGVEYQRKAMRSDADFLLQLGRIDKKERDSLVRDAETASQGQITRWRSWLRDNKFDGKVVTDVKGWLTEQEKAQATASAGRG